MQPEDMEYLIDRAAELVVASHRIVVFTGAGVSTESGIPDFRSPGGIWSRYDPDDFTIQKFLAESRARKLHWKMFKESKLIADAEPNAAHYAVAELERMGKLDCVVTQNVDNLHQKAGNSPEKVYELHGNMQWVKCLSCGRRYTMAEVMQRVERGAEDPPCLDCQGILKPEGIFFGEPLPERELREATLHSRKADLCLVIGSTLVVYPAALMPRYAVEAGAKLVIVNLTSTPLDHYATVILQGKAGEMMTRVMEKVRRGK